MRAGRSPRSGGLERVPSEDLWGVLRGFLSGLSVYPEGRSVCPEGRSVRSPCRCPCLSRNLDRGLSLGLGLSRGRRLLPVRRSGPRPPDSPRPPERWASAVRGRGLQLFELDARGRQDHVAGDVDAVLLTGVQGADLVFVHGQGAVVSGVRFTVHQGPGLVDGTRGEDRVREGDDAESGRGGSGGEAEQPCGGDEECGDVPAKAWARTLPSVAWVPVGSVRTQVTPSRAAPRTCQLAAWSSRRMGRPSSSSVRSTDPR